MRAAAVVLAAFLAACGTPAALAQAPATVAPAVATPMFASEGGMLRPIANGGRVALGDGWMTVALATAPAGEADLDVAVFDGAGHPVACEVRVAYESMDMDHGRTIEHAVRRGDHQRMHLSFVMPGAWRLLVTVARAGRDETVTLVLPQAGF